MKIYTKTGDKGETSLLGGRRVPKDHLRIAAYGAVDELNAHLGMLRDLAGEDAGDLTRVQEVLFTIGSRLAAGDDATAKKFEVPELKDRDVALLEEQMDAWDAELPPLRNFVLPGGHAAISQAHICRTVCRRSERQLVHLAGTEEVPEQAIRYLNRLSDLLFVLARHLHYRLGVPETPWKPKG